MGYGRRYSLKMEKKDEINPGPKYETDKVKSFEQFVTSIQPMKNSTFGTDMDSWARVTYHGQEK